MSDRIWVTGVREGSGFRLRTNMRRLVANEGHPDWGKAPRIKAKRWDLGRTVNAPDIQRFVGALPVKKATKGLFITTARFSESARNCAEDQTVASIALVDGWELANLMIEYGVGVSARSIFEVKALDSDFFDEL